MTALDAEAQYIEHSGDTLATITETTEPTLSNGDAEKEPCLPTTGGDAPHPLPNSTTPKKKVTLQKAGFKSGCGLEDKLHKRWGLNREGYLVTVCGFILCICLHIILVVLLALWPRGSPYGSPCTSAACLRASASIIPTMEPTVAPCTDVFTHACGGWLRTFPKPPSTRHRWDPQEELSLRLAEDVRNMIATLPHPTRTHSVTWNMKYFYDSCMALDNIETDGNGPLRKIINALGGWSVLREFSVHAWDLSQALVRLHSDYGVGPFFRVAVVPDPFNSSQSIVELSPSELGLPDQQYYHNTDGRMATSYRHFIKDVVTLLGATSTDAKSFSDDMFYFERRIAEVLPPTAVLADYRTHRVMNVTGLKTIAQSIPIQEILSALMPKANIGDNTPLLVTSPAYMTSLSSIISTTDRTALNGYFLWKLTQQYLPYLNQVLQDIRFVYLRDTTGVSESLERWEFCAKTLLKYQGVAVAARLERSVPEASRLAMRAFIGEMFHNIKWAVKDSATKAEWIDLEMYQHVVRKLDNLELQVGLTKFYLDDGNLNDFYNSKLQVQKNDFFQNIRYGIEYLKEDMQRRYLNPKPEYTWLSETTMPQVLYIPAVNKLLVPSITLREPWVHADYPPGLLYGGLGVQMSHEILSSILPPFGFYEANGTLLPPSGLVANLMRTSIDNQLSCLMHKSLGNSSTQARSTFLSLSAVRQALKGLRRQTKSQTSLTQPGLEELNDARLMILRYSQSQCVVQTAQDSSIQAATSAPLIGEALLTSLMNNVKTLTDTLGCSAPTDPCPHLL